MGITGQLLKQGLKNTIVVAIDIRDNIIWAGTAIDGVFLSTDYGDSWSLKNPLTTDDVVLSIAASGQNIFCCTNNGLYRSTDNGINWSDIDVKSNKYISSLKISGNNIFAGTPLGLYCSTDNGNN